MFVNVDSAIEKIEDLTKQKCNFYTLLHYVSNGYMNVYFNYCGELYEKSYRAILERNYSEEDFTIVGTECFLGKLKLSHHEGVRALNTILLNNENYLVGNVFKGDDERIFHPLKDGNHKPDVSKSHEEVIALLELLIEQGEIDSSELFLKHCSQVNLSQINKNVYLIDSSILFKLEEIESIPLSHHALNSNGTFYASELGLALELWEEIYLKKGGVFPEGKNLEKVINELLENYEITSTKLKSLKADTDETGRLKARLKVLLNLSGKNKIKKIV
jgi:hypothetical protein